MAITTGGNATLRRNGISKNGDVGIKVMNGGGGIFEDNEIFANAWVGVQIIEGGNLTLRRNRISLNGDVGIGVYSGGGGIFEDNDLRGNGRGAWDINTRSKALVQRKGNLE